MNIRDLKSQVLNKEVSHRLLILECPENFFVANQYIDKIANDRNQTIIYTDSLEKNTFDSGYLYVYTCDTLDHTVDRSLTDYIIKCNSCTIKELDDYIVTIPKLENWQIQNYAKYNLKGLSDEAIMWLCKICNNDIYRLEGEINKLKSFEINERNDIFNQYNLEDGYSDLTNFDIFSLSNALIKRDIQGLSNLINEIKYIDIEPFALINILIKGFKSVIKVQLSKGICPAGMTDKQFYAIRNSSINKYSNDKLRDIYSFLNSLDSLIKSGNLQVDNLIDYIIINIIGE